MGMNAVSGDAYGHIWTLLYAPLLRGYYHSVFEPIWNELNKKT